jgi:multidrug efflux system outer membrane protein
VLPVLAVMGACTVGSDHRPPGAVFADRYHSARSSTPRDPDSHWWKAFGSPVVDEFVDRGLSQNLRIQQALQRVVEARARLDAVVAAPLSGSSQATGEGAAGRAILDRFGRNTVVQAGLSSTAAWQIDLFGRFRRQRESGSASLDVARIDVEAAKLQFIAEMVDAAVDASAFLEGDLAARQNLRSQERLVATLRQSLNRGEGTSLAVARAESLMHATAAQIPSFAAGFQNAVNRLSVLLDEPAPGIEAKLRTQARVLLPRRSERTGQPADLLRRRPDVRRAERALAIATADAGVAEALLYPSISINGTISVTELAAHVGTAGRFGASLGPQISVPVLDLPRLRANLSAQRSLIESRHLEWRSTVISAVAEVDTAIARLRSARLAVDRLERAVEANQRAARLVAQAFGEGVATYSEVLDVERSLAQSREQLITGRQQVAKTYVQLHMSLGAGSEAVIRPITLIHQHMPATEQTGSADFALPPITETPAPN